MKKIIFNFLKTYGVDNLAFHFICICMLIISILYNGSIMPYTNLYWSIVLLCLGYFFLTIYSGAILYDMRMYNKHGIIT